MSEPESPFDPNASATGTDSLYGLESTLKNSATVVIPAPFEATVSYRCGTARGPQAIKEASLQIDLLDEDLTQAWEHGIWMDKISESILQISDSTKVLSKRYRQTFSKEDLGKINDRCADVLSSLEATCLSHQREGKTVCLLGGDHSMALANIRASSQLHQNFGILQIDAHCDLRDTYEGFLYSHASVMRHASTMGSVSKLVQVGIRDYCPEERQYIESLGSKAALFTTQELFDNLFSGNTWLSQCETIVDSLPEHVHISFDIDGLDPSYCPETGTPVPGGLSYQQAVYLLRHVVASGRRIISFDLCEVAGESQWDAIVGARMLYKLCNLARKSNLGS